MEPVAAEDFLGASEGPFARSPPRGATRATEDDDDFVEIGNGVRGPTTASHDPKRGAATTPPRRHTAEPHSGSTCGIMGRGDTTMWVQRTSHAVGALFTQLVRAGSGGPRQRTAGRRDHEDADSDEDDEDKAASPSRARGGATNMPPGGFD